MDERWQAEGRDKQVLALFVVNVRTMNMTADVAWDGIFRPTPFLHGSRIELQFTRKGREALVGFIIDHHADGGAVARDLAGFLITLIAIQVDRLPFTLVLGINGSFLLRNS